MQPRLIILSCLVFLVSLSSAQVKTSSKERDDSLKGVMGHWIGDSIWISYNLEGNKVFEEDYAPHVSHTAIGNHKYISYFPNGNKKEEGYYTSILNQTDTLPNTFRNSLHNDTLIQNEYSEIKTGVWKEYHENGQLKSEGNYFPRYFTTIEGPDTIKTDTIHDAIDISIGTKESGIYIKDELWKYYNKSGKLICEEYWKNLRLIKKNEY